MRQRAGSGQEFWPLKASLARHDAPPDMPLRRLATPSAGVLRYILRASPPMNGKTPCFAGLPSQQFEICRSMAVRSPREAAPEPSVYDLGRLSRSLRVIFECGLKFHRFRRPCISGTSSAGAARLDPRDVRRLRPARRWRYARRSTPSAAASGDVRARVAESGGVGGRLRCGRYQLAKVCSATPGAAAPRQVALVLPIAEAHRVRASGSPRYRAEHAGGRPRRGFCHRPAWPVPSVLARVGEEDQHRPAVQPAGLPVVLGAVLSGTSRASRCWQAGGRFAPAHALTSMTTARSSALAQTGHNTDGTTTRFRPCAYWTGRPGREWCGLSCRPDVDEAQRRRTSR